MMKVSVRFTVVSCKATTACSGSFNAEATVKQETVRCCAAVHNVDCRGNLQITGERSSVGGGGSVNVRANVSVSGRARGRESVRVTVEAIGRARVGVWVTY
jgi:hypothetical protein